MRNKNESGFTLVELIVVIALLTIMMGAILQLMDPIRNVYRDTYDTVNTKTCGETMISYVEDKLRYSTNVLVLENYVGVPEITPITGKSTAKVGTSKYEYTNVLIIDNTNIRGSVFNDYKGDNGSSYARKGCKGTIYELKEIGKNDTLNLREVSGGTLGDNIYGDYNHQIDIDVNNVNEGGADLAYLNLKVHSSPMKLDGGTYVLDDENDFDAERSFDLVNININEKKAVKTKDRYAVDSVVDFDTAPDYTSFPQETDVPTGLTANQIRVFDTTNPNNKYTYIFFVINKSDTTKCEVNFMYDPTDPSPSYAGKPYPQTFPVQPGKTLSKADIITMNNLPSRAGYTGYYFTDGSQKVDLSSYIINDDITFIICYTKDLGAVVHTGIFHMPPGMDDQEVEIDNGYSVTGTPDILGYSGYDPTKQYYEWYVRGTSTKAEDYIISTVSSDGIQKAPELTVDYDYKIIDLCQVSFAPDGINVDNTYDQYVRIGENAVNPTSIPLSIPAGKQLDGWYCGSDKIDTMTITNNTSATVFKPVFVDIPPAPPSGAVISLDSINTNTSFSNYSWDGSVGDNKVDQAITVSFNLKNSGVDNSKASDVIKIRVKTNEDIDSVSINNWEGHFKSATKVDSRTVLVEVSNFVINAGQNRSPNGNIVIKSKNTTYQNAGATINVESYELVS